MSTVATSTEVVDCTLHWRPSTSRLGAWEPAGAGADVGDGHGVVELGGGRETLDDRLVVVDEAQLVPVRGDAVEEGPVIRSGVSSLMTPPRSARRRAMSGQEAARGPRCPRRP